MLPLLGLITKVRDDIYWFNGRFDGKPWPTGEYRAVDGIPSKPNQAGRRGKGFVTRQQEGGWKSDHSSSAEGLLIKIFIAVLFATAGVRFPRADSSSSVTLISHRHLRLYKAISWPTAGGAWDNAKKIVEVEMTQKGTPLHVRRGWRHGWRYVQGDRTRFASTRSSTFTTLFGLLGG